MPCLVCASGSVCLLQDRWKPEKLKKDNEISEDEEKRFNDEIQKFTDEFVKKIDDALAQKEKDIMQV